jgi:hypothetical protein
VVSEGKVTPPVEESATGTLIVSSNCGSCDEQTGCIRGQEFRFEEAGGGKALTRISRW